ncbi:hypothetical protein ACH5RR_030307 [Cinchona calisaya]|uniref:Late blight resistance protein R1A-like N-terminal domain-containing protein n=1 Tax=Cinchona calisaya TaxID=153742 RepID=A0ABD2YU77_9GENT
MDDLVNNFTDLSISKVHNFHLPDTVKRQVEALKGNLRFLRCFFNYVTMRGTDYEEIKDLLTHTRSVASEAACLFYACLVEEMSPQTAFDMNFQFCNLLRMIKPIKPDVRQIYIQVLKDSSSSGSSVLSPAMNEHATVGFIGSLLEFIPELLNRKASDMISLRDHMTMLQVELRFLNDFFMDFPRSCTDPAVYGNHDLMRSIEAVTRESGSAIFSLSDEEIEGNISWQMNIMLSDLLEKGEIKQMFLELSKALRDKLPLIGGLEFIEFLLGNLKELFW